MYPSPNILMLTLDSWSYISIVELNWFILSIENFHENYDISYTIYNIKIHEHEYKILGSILKYIYEALIFYLEIKKIKVRPNSNYFLIEFCLFQIEFCSVQHWKWK